MSNLDLSALAFATPANPYIAFFIYLAFALWIMRFARLCYGRPYIMLERWYKRELPQKNWARQLLRGFAVVWIFIAFLMIEQGVMGLPFFKIQRGPQLLIYVAGIAALGTILVLWKIRREKMLPTKHKA